MTRGRRWQRRRRRRGSRWETIAADGVAASESQATLRSPDEASAPVAMLAASDGRAALSDPRGMDGFPDRAAGISGRRRIDRRMAAGPAPTAKRRGAIGMDSDPHRQPWKSGVVARTRRPPRPAWCTRRPPSGRSDVQHILFYPQAGRRAVAIGSGVSIMTVLWPGACSSGARHHDPREAIAPTLIICGVEVVVWWRAAPLPCRCHLEGRPAFEFFRCVWRPSGWEARSGMVRVRVPEPSWRRMSAGAWPGGKAPC